MRAVGIVAEYNPFHTGHAWHIAQTRRRLGGERAIVCAMSGHWVQRGECALTDKWRRAELALRGGADLVLELPTLWACASAEAFARGAVEVLAGTGVVDTLSFGSESGELESLRAAADCLNREEYHREVRRLAGTGMAFPAARQAAAAALLEQQGRPDGADCLARPNDNLGIEYLRFLPAGWEAMTVQRRGVAHDGGAAEGFASASHLRQLLRAGESGAAEPFLTQPWQGNLADGARCERLVLDRLRTMEEGDWALLPDSGAREGLPERLVRCGRAAGTVEEFLTLAKTRRYTHARLRRMVTWAFLGLTARDRPAHVPYLRVLGFNHRGRVLLAEMKEKATLPILTKPAHARALSPEGRALFALESRCTDRFGLCLEAVPPCGEEWRHSPVVLRETEYSVVP